MLSLLIGLAVTCALSLHQCNGLPTVIEQNLQQDDDTEPSPEIVLSETELNRLEAFLIDLLQEEEWSEMNNPLFYVEGSPEIGDSPIPWKRSRYYRRYPWKRQNGRSNYDPEGFVCNPSKQDVFQLLVALHDARGGNLNRTINFCNRKRPAHAIFTNMRFLGRRKK